MDLLFFCGESGTFSTSAPLHANSQFQEINTFKRLAPSPDPRERVVRSERLVVRERERRNCAPRFSGSSCPIEAISGMEGGFFMGHDEAEGLHMF